MKAPAALLLTLALVPGAATAGEIYGTIREGGKPLAAGARVTVACGGKNATADTDKNGSYRLFAAEEGKCTLTVNVGGESPSIEIHSYADSARYNLVVEKKDGKRTLRTE
ncbi:MAG TPA: hypothetical protein VI297_05370 [Gemmatimonadales bacterium]